MWLFSIFFLRQLFFSALHILGRSELGQSALIMAAHFDHTQVVRALLECKATNIDLQVPVMKSSQI